ncbi:MAG: putative Zn finger-like uncharacterized protein [Candidatus Azotimanducaceae bacterium]|jgi:predicted Zn finger-like uncharacterized protein
MSLLSFAARCPHCNHEFTVRVDAEKIRNRKGKVSCSNCKQPCQIEGEGTYYLVPVARLTPVPPVQTTHRKAQKQEPRFTDEDVIEYKVVDDEPVRVPISEPKEEPEREGTIFDVLAFVSVVLTGIVLMPLVAGLFSDNFSLQNTYENTMRAFSGGILRTGIAMILGLIVGAVATFIVVSVTKLETTKAANLLGVCTLCFGVYGFLNAGSEIDNSVGGSTYTGEYVNDEGNKSGALANTNSVKGSDSDIEIVGQGAAVANDAGSEMAATIGSLTDVVGTNYNYDTKTKLYWLDVTETVNMSYKDISNKMDGGALKGWKIAERPQIDTLFANATNGMFKPFNADEIEDDIFMDLSNEKDGLISILGATTYRAPYIDDEHGPMAGHKSTSINYLQKMQSSGYRIDEALISLEFGEGFEIPSDIHKSFRNTYDADYKEEYLGWFLYRKSKP